MYCVVVTRLLEEGQLSFSDILTTGDLLMFTKGNHKMY